MVLRGAFPCRYVGSGQELVLFLGSEEEILGASDW
jgi:hypothetical protein